MRLYIEPYMTQLYLTFYSPNTSNRLQPIPTHLAPYSLSKM